MEAHPAQKLLWLIDDVDQLIEHALSERLEIAETLPLALDRLLKYVPADVVVVRVPDEDGEDCVFRRPAGVEMMKDHVDAIHDQLTRMSSLSQERQGGIVHGQRLDLRHDFLGSVMAWCSSSPTADEREFHQRALYHWAEIVDNYVASVLEARAKQRAIELVSDALKTPLLEAGLDEAIAHLRSFVEFDALLLACTLDPILGARPFAYRFQLDDETRYSSSNTVDPRIDRLARESAERLLRNEMSEVVLEELQIRPRFIEDVPIHGRDGILGRVLIGSERPISRFDSDLVGRFVDYLRHRILAFGSEWNRLCATFGKETATRLLREPDYRMRHLAPRHEVVVLLEARLDRFAERCEDRQIAPEEVRALLRRWHAHVADIVWELGGILESQGKARVTAVFGPPYFERSTPQAAAAAADAAWRIREFTTALTDSDATPEPLRASVSLHQGAIYLGALGVDDEFHVIGSNSTVAAALCDAAGPGEILASLDLLHMLGSIDVGPERRVEVAANQTTVTARAVAPPRQNVKPPATE